MLRYNAVLFDLDGTLLDTADDLAHALNHALYEYGFPTHAKENVTGFLGSGAQALIARALPPHTDTATAAKVQASFQQRYDEYTDRHTHPFPGVLPMLSALDEAGLKLAIISNKSDAAVKKLTKTFFGSLVHIAIGARAGVPIKPSPEMLMLAMEKLGAQPEHALYIGDMPIDLETAHNAGADCILARWGYGDPKQMQQLSPDFFVSDPAELPMLILQEQEDAP